MCMYAHNRKQQNILYPVVHFTGDIKFKGKREGFLSFARIRQYLMTLINKEVRLRDSDFFKQKNLLTWTLQKPQLTV